MKNKITSVLTTIAMLMTFMPVSMAENISDSMNESEIVRESENTNTSEDVEVQGENKEDNLKDNYMKYDVSTEGEFNDAVTKANTDSNENVVICLQNDITLNKPFVGIEGKHIYLTSKEGEKYTLNNSIYTYELIGDFTLDNINISPRISKLYANGYTFETTENFVGNIGSIYGGANGQQVSSGGDGDGEIELENYRSNKSIVNNGTNIILRGEMKIGYLYGGGYRSDVTGSVNILVDNKNTSIDFIFGGGCLPIYADSAKVNGNINIHLKKGKFNSLYGGGRDEKDYDDTRKKATVTGNINFTVGDENNEDKVARITGDSWGENSWGFHGGSYHSTIEGDININFLKGAYTQMYDPTDINSYIYGQGSKDDLYGKITINIKDAILDYAYINTNGGQGFSSGESEYSNQYREGKDAVHLIYDCPNKTRYHQCYIRLGNDNLTGNLHGNTLVELKNGALNGIDMTTLLYGNDDKDKFKGNSVVNIYGGKVARIIGQSIVYDYFPEKYKNEINFYGESRIGSLNTFDNVNVLNKSMVYIDSKYGYDEDIFDSIKNLNINSNGYLVTRGKDSNVGNVNIDDGSWLTEEKIHVKGDWDAKNKAILKLPVVEEGSNYDGNKKDKRIPLRIDGNSTGQTKVYTINPTTYKAVKPSIGENYIVGGKKDADNPVQDTFVLGNEDALNDGLFLKRVDDLADKENNFMWQVEKDESLTLGYKFVSDDNNKTKLPEAVLEEVEQFEKENGHHDGDVIDIDKLNEEIEDKDIEVSGGTWYFKGWAYKENENSGYEYIDKDKIEMHKDMELVGVWHFEPNSTGGGGGTITPPTKPEEPDRIEGGDRIETSIESSKDLYPNGTNAVVLANCERYTDVLTADPFAIQEKASALLTYKYELPEKTLKEIERLGAKKIYISGGYDAVSKKVVDELAAKGYEIFRFDGVDRYDTARKIAIKIREKGNTNAAELASGENYPDALCMTPLAVKDHAPILLTKKDSIPKYTKQALAEWDIENIKIGGLEKAVSPEVEKQLKSGFEIEKNNKKDSNVYDGAKAIKRIGGEDRYETSAKLAKESYPESKLGVYATGEDFPDALIAGNYAGTKEAPVLLVKGDSLPEPIEKYTKESKIKKATIIGGVNAVSDKVFNLIKVIINNK